MSQKSCTYFLHLFIIPLLRHFTILGYWNAQNMPLYYSTIVLFYYIGVSERTKYATILHWRTGQKYRRKAVQQNQLTIQTNPGVTNPLILNTTQLAKYRAYYMLNHSIRGVYFSLNLAKRFMIIIWTKQCVFVLLWQLACNLTYHATFQLLEPLQF